MLKLNKQNKAVLAACLSIILALSGAAFAEGEMARLGDLNMDGTCNVLDIQAAICQALQTQTRTREANLDEDDDVDVLDVQNCINTALGTGGMLQRVRGRVMCDDPELAQEQLRIRATSMDGEHVEGDIDPETGEFLLRLRVKTAWSFAVCAAETDPARLRFGTMEFPVGEDVSCTVPIPELARGGDLDLGEFQFGNRMQCQQELRNMVGHLNTMRHGQDTNGDGIPDCAEPLMNRVQNGPGVPQGMNQNGLKAIVAECIEAWLSELTAPSLTDDDADGIPDFVAPLIVCLETSIPLWFEEQGQQVPQGDQDHDGVADKIEDIVAEVVAGIPDWLASLDDPDVIDVNGNGIPDYLENLLGLGGTPNNVDNDGDGIPDFAQDSDGDGIPNCLDEDARHQYDCDGDGVPNECDQDKDNDGVPNYADADQCDPNIQ